MKNYRPAIVGLISGIAGGGIIFLMSLILVSNYPSALLSFLGSNVGINSTATSTPAETVRNILTREVYTQESIVVETIESTQQSVVSITVSKSVPVIEQYYESVPGDPFADLFGGGFNIQIPQLRQNGSRLQQVGSGSGFIVSADGLIVTNRHVVADKTAEYSVFLNSGKKYGGKVVARDPVNDLAIIKIEATGLPYLEFANSDGIKVGQTAIAIGNALGEFKNSVSVGVVSGLARSITAGDMAGMSEQLDNVIQTDAAINPGNSGGPLLDLSGNVIGVNVAVAQGSQSIAFSIPSNVAKSVVESVKKVGTIVRPYIGIRYTVITPELQEANSLNTEYGVLIIRGSSREDLAVVPGSPADKAGLVENDIILEADGKRLTDQTSLATIVREHKVGDTMTLKVLSKGTTKNVKIILESSPE